MHPFFFLLLSIKSLLSKVIIRNEEKKKKSSFGYLFFLNSINQNRLFRQESITTYKERLFHQPTTDRYDVTNAARIPKHTPKDIIER
jgi:hypothetical protein